MSERCHAALALHMDHASDGWASRVTLALRAGGGDAHAALDELHSECAQLVANAALSALPTRRDLALDAAQDAWVRIATRPAHCRTQPELEAWIRRVVLSAAVDLLRRELRQAARARASAHSGAHSHDRARVHADAVQLEQLQAALRQLTSQERVLLDLRYRAGMTLAQIAATVGIGPAAADSKMRRAIERLRAQEELP